MFKKILDKIRNKNNKNEKQPKVDKTKPEEVKAPDLSMDEAMDILKEKAGAKVDPKDLEKGSNASTLGMDEAMDILKAKAEKLEQLQPIDTVPYKLTAMLTQAVTVMACSVAGAYYGGTAIVAGLGMAGTVPTVFLGAAGLMVGGFVGGIATIPVAAVTLTAVAIYKGDAKKFLSHIKDRITSRRQSGLTQVNDAVKVTKKVEPSKPVQEKKASNDFNRVKNGNDNNAPKSEHATPIPNNKPPKQKPKNNKFGG